MKRRDFIKHLENNSCYLFREGSKHSVFQNIKNNKKTTIPRHSNLDKDLVNLICKQLEIPKPY
jgi:mRNA interferase HicA